MCKAATLRVTSLDTDIGASGPASEQCIEWYEVVFFKGWHHEYSSCLNPKHIYVYGYNQTNILTLKNNQKIICNGIMVVPIVRESLNYIEAQWM